MIKTMSIGTYVLNGSKILFMKKNPADRTVNIYFDNYEFVLDSNSISIRSLFNVCGNVGKVHEGHFFIFVTDEKSKSHRIDSTDPDFIDKVINLFQAV